MIHGPICGAKTIPNYPCRYCGEKTFFFFCDCGCGVLFDELGPPWPEHDCRNQSADSPPYAGPSSWGSTIGINVWAGNPGSYDLLPGLKHGTDSIAPAVLKLAQENRNLTRETMRIEPHGSRSVSIVGVVRELSQPDIARRYGLERSSVGFGLLATAIGDADPVQLTVQVDELPDDEAAIDYLSYTLFVASSKVGKNIGQHAVIRARLSPVDVMGVARLWLAREIECLY